MLKTIIMTGARMLKIILPDRIKAAIECRSISKYRIKALNEIPPKSSTMNFSPISGRVLYIINNSLPHSSNGYATRSHGVISGLQNAGLELVTFTRPGYPWDQMKGKFDPIRDDINSVIYNRMRYPSLREFGMHNYLLPAAAAVERTILQQRPSVVMAASDYNNALPALIASRRLGVPFIYDVRGFWEITRGSREPDFSETTEFKSLVSLETATAQGADMVLTLNQGMRHMLVERGVDIGKIHLFPNSYAPEHFPVLTRDWFLAEKVGIPSGVPVIGYVGSFVDYEGLDDLVAAAALIKQEGLNFRLLIVGGDESNSREISIKDMIRQSAEKLGLSNWLIMLGRVPFETVSAYYSLIDICPFPRKPWPVCELVSPIKTVEAMAMGKPLVLPNLTALAELGRDGETMLMYEKGNIKSLSQALAKLIVDTRLRNQMGKAGKVWAQNNLTWTATSLKVASLILSLEGKPEDWK